VVRVRTTSSTSNIILVLSRELLLTYGHLNMMPRRLLSIGYRFKCEKILGNKEQTKPDVDEDNLVSMPLVRGSIARLVLLLATYF